MADLNGGDHHNEQQGDPLLFNKIAAAVLTALLFVFGLPQLTKAFMGGGHHGGGDGELHLAYCCVELETQAAGAGEEEVFDLGTALAAASPSAGERRSAICASCHSFEKGGADGTGPNLWDIVGRDVGANAGFGYSSALQALDGVWTYERLDAYLKNSQDYVPGGSMVQRFPQDERRAEILAYLGSLSDDPQPFPAPAAPPSAGPDAEIDEAVDG